MYPKESDEGGDPVVELGVVGLLVVELIVVAIVGLVDVVVDEEQLHGYMEPVVKKLTNVKADRITNGLS